MLFQAISSIIVAALDKWALKYYLKLCFTLDVVGHYVVHRIDFFGSCLHPNYTMCQLYPKGLMKNFRLLRCLEPCESPFFVNFCVSFQFLRFFLWFCSAQVDYGPYVAPRSPQTDLKNSLENFQLNGISRKLRTEYFGRQVFF